jgi:hypothetical protein
VGFLYGKRARPKSLSPEERQALEVKLHQARLLGQHGNCYRQFCQLDEEPDCQALYPLDETQLQLTLKDIKNNYSAEHILQIATISQAEHISDGYPLTLDQYNNLIQAGASQNQLPDWFVAPADEPILVSIERIIDDLEEADEKEQTSKLDQLSEQGYRFLEARICERESIFSNQDLDYHNKWGQPVVSEYIQFDLKVEKVKEPLLGLSVRGLGLKRSPFGMISAY